MRAPAELLASAPPELHLGLPGFQFEDLYRPRGLARLSETFEARLAEADPALCAVWRGWREGSPLPAAEESSLLIAVSAHVSAFIGALFGIGDSVESLRVGIKDELSLFGYRRDFIQRRVYKKGAPDRPTAAEFPSLDARVRLLWQLGFPEAFLGGDEERGLATSVLFLLELERLFTGQSAPGVDQVGLRARWAGLREALLSSTEGKDAFATSLLFQGEDAEELKAVRALISLVDRWTFARALHPEARQAARRFSTHKQPHMLHFDRLVEVKHPLPELPEAIEGPDATLRARDGFKLTDDRRTPREVMGEIESCVFCHERGKDSCSTGMKTRDPVAEGGTFKKNPLGIDLAGCPLDEKISEHHVVRAKGDAIAGLAMVMIDNPMVPGTGHRICNDCMKACIFQKQEPVNIPLVETSSLTDVLALPWGFEIYGLLTRWNPLNRRRPHALPYNGKNVLIVGLGPAGYTLSHYLANEGFAVTGVDGLKVEPFPDELTGHNGAKLTPIRDWKDLTSALDERVVGGFGGVSEYGITVRWDKNFLNLLHLTLARRENLRFFGGVRFGGTLTVEDAWELGFDHLAIAAGAGRPTLVPMKNNLLRGIRKASDFLMALQLSGSFKRDSLANLQVELPAVVIGGGLTGIDTATELMAYYPVQVEKMLERHEQLCASIGEEAIHARLSDDEKARYAMFLEHGRAIRAEREKAAAEERAPNFIQLVRGWGGVSLVYRRAMTESPAYRLNHEEVAKALEEGIRFIEHMSPTEAVPDGRGAVKALKFERMRMVEGKLVGSGETIELPARTVCIAAGTSPNVTYEREFPGTFQLDARAQYFQGHVAHADPGAPGGLRLEPVPPAKDLTVQAGFFTSYQRENRFITFYGDNHPAYAGNVVKAMASAKDGYPEVVRAFASHLSSLDPADEVAQASRERAREAHLTRVEEALSARVVSVTRLTPTIVEVVVHAPFAARRFEPGQFYRLQNFERTAPIVDGTRLAMEGLALTGAWVDKEKGLLGTIVLEMGTSSRLCATLRPDEPVVLMGPTGAATEIHSNETVLLAGGGLGNAVLFSIARSLKAAGCTVVYFAGYRTAADSFKHEEIEAGCDQVIWSVDGGPPLPARRPQDASFVGNVVQAMVAYAKGELGTPVTGLDKVNRIIAIGSDRMMAAVKVARHGVLQPYLRPDHEAIGSINSPMQCMMKEICAQCLQRHVDPRTGKETVVFSCFNQDQRLDVVDFENLNDRLKGNSLSEKLTDLYLTQLLARAPGLVRV